MPGPLESVKIVDLCRDLAGSYACMLLGDMGAQVVKVDRLAETLSGLSRPSSSGTEGAEALRWTSRWPRAVVSSEGS